MGQVTSDAGPDDGPRPLPARQQLSSRPRASSPRAQHNFTYQPADPERFYDMLLTLANDAAQDRQWETAYNIARQLDDALPPGTDISRAADRHPRQLHQLTWLAGTRRARPAEPAVERGRDVRRAMPAAAARCRCRPRAIIGPAAPRLPPGSSSRPTLFPARRGLSRAVLRPARARAARPVGHPAPSRAAAICRRRRPSARPSTAAAWSRRCGCSASRARSTEQALFVRALAESLDNDADRDLAVELGQQIGRQDLAVWVARIGPRSRARCSTSARPIRPCRRSVSASLWSLAHGISRQESSFDPYAVSHAGARGMMQLMTGTAREQAGKMGVGYDSYRLISDPSYNVMLGSAYFQRHAQHLGRQRPARGRQLQRRLRQRPQMGRTPMATRAARSTCSSGSRRSRYVETKAYVQRVIENSVVYDSMRGTPAAADRRSTSRAILGRDRPA